MGSSASIAQELAEHRNRTEQTIAPIRCDASLNDRQKGRLITDILAEANARFAELRAEYRHALEAEAAQVPTGVPSARHRPLFGLASPSRPLGAPETRTGARR